MDWGLVSIAEMWRKRWSMGLPVGLGMLLALLYTAFVPPLYEARATLQVQADAARAPILRHLDAPGQLATLRQIITNPDLLGDTGHDAGRVLKPRFVTLDIINNHLIGVGYRSPQPEGLEQLVDGLAFNFIQALLAPERLRIEQLLTQNEQELREIAGRLRTSDGMDGPTRTDLVARQDKLQTESVQLQSDLRLVNTAFGSHGSQALVWFAEPAGLIEPLSPPARLLRNLIVGGLLGFGFAWVVFEMPRRNRRTVNTPAVAAHVTGLPVVGTLPWLGKVKVMLNGLTVMAGGKQLRPADFSEVARLQRTLVRGLRGPLSLLGVSGQEGVSALALMLAEKTASQGKRVALVDMNLKNRTLSQWLGLGDGNWELPHAKKGSKAKWDALHSMPGQPDLLLLAAPRHPQTLQKLGDAGGLPVLFDLLGEIVDVVIVDGSPLAALNRGNVDAVAVATASSRVALVTQAEVTSRDDLKRATDSLLLVGAPLLGTVLNQQYAPSRRQLLGQLADRLGKVVPPLGRWLRKASIRAHLE